MRRIFCTVLLFMVFHGFAQTLLDTDIVRDYVGLISVADHSDLITFVNKIKTENMLESGEEETGKPEPPKREPPYERLAGSGFLFTAKDGSTYIITNRHVISEACHYAITFEKNRNEKTVYTDLVLLAADEEKDLAILAFAPGSRPSRGGLPLLSRQVREGEEVFTAGFPALGREAVWQFGRGQVSNAQVMLPSNWDEDEFDGPFIQHTGQADPGNSGGPLLVSDSSAPAGFAVAGVNARSALRRQAANYAVPADAIREFIEDVFNPRYNAETQRIKLDKRLEEFTKGIKERNLNIFNWISYRCFVENAEYAFYIDAEKYRWLIDDPWRIMQYGTHSLFAKSLPSSQRKLKTTSIKTVEAVDGEEPAYKVIFEVGRKEINSLWIIEHGIWRIASFGKLDGDKAQIARAEKLFHYQRNIRDGEKGNYSLFVEGAYTLIPNEDNAIYAALGPLFMETEIGLRFYYADQDYWQTELFVTYYTPHLRFGVLALGLDFRPGVGFKKLPRVNNSDTGMRLGLSPQLGVQITSSIIPGLYLGAAYQYNWYFHDSADKSTTRHLFLLLGGYRFKERRE
ncbi:hypothetical protein AGMMS50230_04990 [Spirochaetia bacterium]|nr:hypothetical protein AGMMS50230_04990 [Spirochaetia bacterium]